MKKIRKQVLIFCCIAIVLLVFSVTIVPQVQGKVVAKTLNKAEKAEALTQLPKKLSDKEQIKKIVHEITSLVKQITVKDDLKHSDIQKLQTALKDIVSTNDFPQEIDWHGLSNICVNGHEQINIDEQTGLSLGFILWILKALAYRIGAIIGLTGVCLAALGVVIHFYWTVVLGFRDSGLIYKCIILPLFRILYHTGTIIYNIGNLLFMWGQSFSSVLTKAKTRLEMNETIS